MGSASRYDSALSPALRGHRLLFQNGDTGRIATSPGCPRRDSWRKALTGKSQKSKKNFLKEE